METWLRGSGLATVRIGGPIVTAEWLESNLWSLGAFCPEADFMLLDWRVAPQAEKMVRLCRKIRVRHPRLALLLASDDADGAQTGPLVEMGCVTLRVPCLRNELLAALEQALAARSNTTGAVSPRSIAMTGPG